MPFNNTTKRFDRVWRFVDQFLANENATRTSFDVTIDDVRDAVNAAISYLEGRDDALAVSANDLRYIGAFSAAPATRVGGGALVLGDFYFDTDDEEFLVFDGTGFVSTTGLTTAMRTFLSLIETDDDAAVRSLIGLGTAAVQNIAAFATAAQGVRADASLQVPGGFAVNVLDWYAVHGLGSGFYEGAAGAANAPAAVAGRGIYIKQSTSSGVLLMTNDSNNVYFATYSSGSWGAWRQIGSNRGTITDLNTLNTGFGVCNYAQSATGAEVIAGLPTYTAVGLFFGNGTNALQIAFAQGATGLRIRAFGGGSWSPWAGVVDSSNLGTYIAGMGTTAVGSYLFAGISSAYYGLGAVVAGSALRGCGMYDDGSGFVSGVDYETTYLTGSWLCCGRSPGLPGVRNGFTLFRRVA